MLAAAGTFKVEFMHINIIIHANKTNLKCKYFWGNNELGQGQYQVVQDLINPPALISRLPSLTLPNRLCKNPRESLYQRKIKQNIKVFNI